MESSRKHTNFRDMATDFALMQVDLCVFHSHILWNTHTDPRLNERVDHGRLTQNPWWPHGITIKLSVICQRNLLQCKLMTLLFRGTHTDPRFNDRVNLV